MRDDRFCSFLLLLLLLLFKYYVIMTELYTATRTERKIYLRPGTTTEAQTRYDTVAIVEFSTIICRRSIWSSDVLGSRRGLSALAELSEIAGSERLPARLNTTFIVSNQVHPYSRGGPNERYSTLWLSKFIVKCRVQNTQENLSVRRHYFTSKFGFCTIRSIQISTSKTCPFDISLFTL